VDRDLDVDVHRGYVGGGAVVVHDNDWNWGTFAAGAAAGAVTSAAVAAAARPSTVVVTPPAIGTVVSALPTGCAAVEAQGVAVYNCGNIYYRPVYQGSALVYQVVPYP
jgi:hypothetical protein